jgi:hypothetical protein
MTMTTTCRHWEMLESPKEGQGDKVLAVCKWCGRERLLFASWQDKAFNKSKGEVPA